MLPENHSRRCLAVLALALAGCAAAGHDNAVGGAGGSGGAGGVANVNGGSDGSMSMSPVDLAGADLTGVDLTGFGSTGDMAGPPCDVVSQTNCGSGEKCTLGMSGTVCAVDGSKTTGQLCGASMADDCIHGDLCIGESTTLNQCREACNTDSDCKQAAVGGLSDNVGHCIITLMGSTVKVCSVACQPVPTVGASGCAAGLGCQVYTYMMGSTNIPELTDCVATGAGTDGSNCATNGDADCSAGFGCVTLTSGSTMTKTCRRYCRAGQTGDCSGLSGYICAVPTGSTHWGFCIP